MEGKLRSQLYLWAAQGYLQSILVETNDLKQSSNLDE